MIQKERIADPEAKDAFKVRCKPIDRNEPEKMCPRCEIPTEVFNYSYDSNVFLNRCTRCRGVWADAGELERTAKYIKGNPAVNMYAESLAKDLANRYKKSLICRLLTSRILSGLVALLYLGGALFTGDSETLWRTATFLVFPLVCIWFSDAMGNYTGFIGFRSPPISQKTPGVFIALGGWLFLLSPLIVAALSSFK
ncbi:MAG: zf-TFIIB domain-containing protein [Kiritimatiellaeota bacterium]|nr:zf-TFIIB domain-containing protein [Kiritimatiellota bacterium]